MQGGTQEILPLLPERLLFHPGQRPLRIVLGPLLQCRGNCLLAVHPVLKRLAVSQHGLRIGFGPLLQQLISKIIPLLARQNFLRPGQRIAGPFPNLIIVIVKLRN